MRPAHERGVALLTVLLLVAVMSALAVAVVDDVRFGVRRTANARAAGQAQWYALGAENLARAQIGRLAKVDAERTPLEGGWNGRIFTFPIEDGMIRARLSDGGACFNLNSVVEGGSGGLYQRRELGSRQFSALLIALRFSEREAEALTDALVDWIDADQVRGALGAEDETYLKARPTPYRTGATLLAEVSELRAVRGFDSAVYARLRPYVCALPFAEPSAFNANTLEPDRAELLVMLTDGDVTLEAARRALAARPEGGWREVAEFWAQPALAAALPSNEVLNQVSLKTRFFGLHAEIHYADAHVVMSSLFERDPGGPAKLIARRWTRDE